MKFHKLEGGSRSAFGTWRC